MNVPAGCTLILKKRTVAGLIACGAVTLVMLLAAGCNWGGAHANRVVVVQPLGDFPVREAVVVYQKLKETHTKIVLRSPMALPAAAYYPVRKRYRADSLIRFLARYGSADTVIIGLTDKDISTTKNDRADWGIMGLANRPGNACVVSTYRLSKGIRSTQFFKVAIHELGHTQGLPHCPDRHCFMRDAESGNPLNEETGFCASCKSFLRGKGWRLG